MSATDPVRRAEGELKRAKYAEQELVRAIVAGDESVTASDLADAEAAVRHAALRLQAAQRLVADEAKQVYEARQEERLEKRRKAQARADEEQRASWQRAIDSGQAARQIQALQSTGPSRPRFPPEYDAMLVDAGLLPPRERQEAS